MQPKKPKIMSKKEKKFYEPFDPLPDSLSNNSGRYRLVPTSKMHVREVCDVMARRMSISDQMRCKYADQAGYETSSVNRESAPLRQGSEGQADERVEKQFTLFDVFSEYHVHAALAEALFAGFPQIIEVHETDSGFEVEITNEQLFDRLDEGAVNEAFLSFNAARSGTPSALRGLSNDLQGVLNRQAAAPAAQNNSRP